MMPEPRTLLRRIDLETPPVGLYDAPDPAAFAPLTAPKPGQHVCAFAFYKTWQTGQTLHLTADNAGCGGAATWLFGVQGRSREEFVAFLVDTEGLKASHELMHRWIDHHRPYVPEHGHLLIGPLRDDQYHYLRTVTFFINPDQLSALVLGANYEHAPGDPPAVISPFGSGCMEILSLFEDLQAPQAIVGATDLAMRSSLPPDRLAFTVTKPMFERLCRLDERSFLYKSFWQDLRRARRLPDFD
jgi:hypothetical protein